MIKLLFILMLGAALASGLAASQPPLLIDNVPAPAALDEAD